MKPLTSFVFGEIPLVARTMAAISERPVMLERFIQHAFGLEDFRLKPGYEWMVGTYLVWCKLADRHGDDRVFSEKALAEGIDELLKVDWIPKGKDALWRPLLREIANTEYDYCLQSGDELFLVEFKITGGATHKTLSPAEKRQVRKQAIGARLLERLEGGVRKARLCYVSPRSVSNITTWPEGEGLAIKIAPSTLDTLARSGVEVPSTQELRQVFDVTDTPIRHVGWSELVTILDEYPETAVLAGRLRENPSIFSRAKAPKAQLAEFT